MNLQEAITTALEFENRVRDVYTEALNRVRDPAGQQIFGVLAKEEQYHVDYLNRRLQEAIKTGTISLESVETAIPSREQIEKGIGELKHQIATIDPDNDLQMLRQALAVELETSSRFRRFITELPPEGKALFGRFAEIEEGHVAIVQAEIDHLYKSGYWFDFLEIDLDGA